VAGARLFLRGRLWWTWGRYASGKRWQASTGCRDRTAALRVAARLERERAAMDGAPHAALTVEHAVRDVIAAREREGKAAGTVAVYVRVGGHLCRILGGATPIDSLTLARLEGYIDRRTTEGAMRSTVAMELSRLRAALLYARRHGRYAGDLDAIWPREALRGASKPKERYLTREEYARLHAHLESYGRGDWLAGYVYTGARRRELDRIEARDVDLVRGTLRIRGVKTRGADRVVPIAGPLREVVERRLRESGGGALWPTWEPTKPLYNACRALSMPRVSCNDLRRTFASWLAQAGVSEMACARLMGHGSSRMVRGVYARFGADDLAAAVAKL
jgi:integrase